MAISKPNWMHRIAGLLVILLLLGGGAAYPAAAQDAGNSALELTIAPAFGGASRSGHWLPVVATVRNLRGGDRLLRLDLQFARGETYRTTLTLPGTAERQVVIHVFPQGARQFEASLFEADQLLQRTTVALDPLEPLNRSIGLIGSSEPERIMVAPGPSAVELIALPTAQFPDRGEVLGNFRALALNQPISLSAAQRQALEEWLSQGGQLLISGDASAASTLAALPAALRPAQIATSETLPAEALFGPEVSGLSLSRAVGEPLAGSSFYQLPGLPQAYPAIIRPFGDGAVLLVPFPLDDRSFRLWSGAETLWSIFAGSPEPIDAFDQSIGGLSRFQDLSLASNLIALPSLDLPPIGILVGLLIGYVLAVGPLCYFVLRRLDRLAWGWIAVPLITLLFSGITYGIGARQRGDERIINEVALVQSFSSANRTLVRASSGIFSPSEARYQLFLPAEHDQTLLRPISLQGPWGGLNPPSGGVLFQAESGLNSAELDVPRWSMSAINGTYSQPSALISATIRLEAGQLTMEVVNQSDYLIEDLVLVQGDHATPIGDLAPQAHQTLPLSDPSTLPPPNGMGLSQILFADQMMQMQMPVEPRAQLNPATLEFQLRQRLVDSLYSYGPIPRTNRPTLFGWSRELGLGVSLAADTRFVRSQLALITSEPEFVAASGTYRFGRGWFEAIDTANRPICYGMRGPGFQPVAGQNLYELRLPLTTNNLVANRLDLITLTDANWPAGASIEIYNWQSQQWQPITRTGDETPIDTPSALVSRQGSLRLRVAFPEENLFQFGCFNLDAALEGTL